MKISMNVKNAVFGSLVLFQSIGAFANVLSDDPMSHGEFKHVTRQRMGNRLVLGLQVLQLDKLTDTTQITALGKERDVLPVVNAEICFRETIRQMDEYLDSAAGQKCVEQFIGKSPYATIYIKYNFGSGAVTSPTDPSQAVTLNIVQGTGGIFGGIVTKFGQALGDMLPSPAPVDYTNGHCVFNPTKLPALSN